jgi:hypothetical protein
VTAAYSSGSVTSADGTRIGYRQVGRGPGLVLVHGGGQAAQNLMQLACSLSNEFTVYVPDRRGRGSSGPPGDHYGLTAESQDLDAPTQPPLQRCSKHAVRARGWSPPPSFWAGTRSRPTSPRPSAAKTAPQIRSSTPWPVCSPAKPSPTGSGPSSWASRSRTSTSRSRATWTCVGSSVSTSRPGPGSARSGWLFRSAAQRRPSGTPNYRQRSTHTALCWTCSPTPPRCAQPSQSSDLGRRWQPRPARQRRR